MPTRTGLIDFTAERQRHARFVGRDDVLARLDDWLDGPGDSGWVVITGGPGMGKSAIVAAWLTRRETAGAVVPHHFIRRQVADWDRPEVIAVSLAAQIEAVYPDLYDPDAKPERRLLELLGRVSKRLGSTERLVVVVDGLDEARAEPGDNPLPRFLPHVVPLGIRFLCTTRPTYPHLNWLEARNPVRRLDLDDDRWEASNAAVVRGFWEAIASDYQPPLPAAAVATAIDCANGNVLHAVMLDDALRSQPAAARRVDRIPRGLKQLIGEIWDQVASHAGVRIGLGLLCAAQEALSLDLLAELAAWSYEDKDRFVRDVRQLLLEEPASWAGGEAYRPRHDWVRELIAERLGAVTIRGHHRTLSQQLASWPPPTDAPRRSYAVRHALTHRIAAYDWSGVRELASDLSYLEAWAHTADVFVLEHGMTDAAASCPDPEAAHDLVDLAWALARESHWIRRDPKGIAGLIWNRLQRLGWTANELDARITIPARAAFLRVRHAAARESGSLERTFEGHPDGVRACAVTPDGRRVVSASDDGTLKVWELKTGGVLATLERHAAGITACAVAPDGRRVISASTDRTLNVWDLDTGRVLATLEGHTLGVTACAVTPDGRRVVSASIDGTLRIWDLDTGRVLTILEGHAFGVTACAVTPDGWRAVSASTDRTLRIWDLDTGRVLTILEGHKLGVTACAVTPDGRRVVSASTDCSLKVWDLNTGRVLVTIHGYGHWVTACAVTPDGRRMVSASTDRSLKIWDLDAGRDLATFTGHAGWVAACVVTPDGRRMISASADRTLKVWDLNASRALTTLDSHAARVNACAMTRDGRRLVSASHDCTLKVWDVDHGCVVATLDGHDDWVTACAVMPDGKRVVSASADRTLKVWDLATGRVLTTLAGRAAAERYSLGLRGFAGEVREPSTPRIDDAIRVLATLDDLAASVRVCEVTPDGKHVVSVSSDGTLKVFDFAGRALATLSGRGSKVRACAVTPDGLHLVSASSDGTLTIWDLAAGRVLTTLDCHGDAVNACTVAPDGQHLISASNDGTLKIWDLTTSRLLATLDGHTDGVTACAVTPDGQRVISASDDCSLKVWDRVSARCLLTHRGDAGFLCVAATTKVIVAGDRAGTVWFLEGPS